MTNLYSSLDYDQCQDFLDDLSGAMSVAEVHGLQTGMICAKPNYDIRQCREELLSEMGCVKQVALELEQSLDKLYVLTCNQLKDLEFSFTPFLPEEYEDILQNSRLLCDWCRGFLCGLALSGIREQSLKQEDAKEALQDLSHIAYAEVEVDQDTAEERHFFELLEYVKIAVQTIHIELRTTLSATHGHNSDTLH